MSTTNTENPQDRLIRALTFTTPERVGERGLDRYRGFTIFGGEIVEHQLGPSFRERPAWADGRARRIWVSERLMCVATYCEGDISLEFCDDAQSFQRWLDYCAAYYER